MTYLAITVLGHDRPGIIAQTAEILADCGMNLEDSSMTMLRRHFAMTLICAGDLPQTEIESALAPLTADGGPYFNAVFAVAAFLAWRVTGWEALLVIVPLQQLQMLKQLLPFVRLDQRMP